MAFIKSRSQELQIPEDNPFENDKLDRSQYSNALTDVVSFYGQSGCVLALGERACKEINSEISEGLSSMADLVTVSLSAIISK